MQDFDLHVHTRYSDGAHSPEEMAGAALAQGIKRLGFSDHAYTSCDLSYCMKAYAAESYKSKLAFLKKQYAGRMEILCGIEQDYFSDYAPSGFDYVIGSVHYVKAGDAYLAVDESRDVLLEGVNNYFGGDIYAFAEAYFELEAGVVEKTGADIIGHFDLVSKFNEDGTLFDPEHPRYIKAWQAAADKLLETGKPFEINTGAMSRGYRKSPYPSAEMRNYIRNRGGRFILSSDSHSKYTLRFAFENNY